MQDIKAAFKIADQVNQPTPTEESRRQHIASVEAWIAKVEESIPLFTNSDKKKRKKKLTTTSKGWFL